MVEQKGVGYLHNRVLIAKERADQARLKSPVSRVVSSASEGIHGLTATGRNALETSAVLGSAAFATIVTNDLGAAAAAAAAAGAMFGDAASRLRVRRSQQEVAKETISLAKARAEKGDKIEIGEIARFLMDYDEIPDLDELRKWMEGTMSLGYGKDPRPVVFQELFRARVEEIKKRWEITGDSTRKIEKIARREVLEDTLKVWRQVQLRKGIKNGDLKKAMAIGGGALGLSVFAVLVDRIIQNNAVSASVGLVDDFLGLMGTGASYVLNRISEIIPDLNGEAVKSFYSERIVMEKQAKRRNGSHQIIGPHKQERHHGRVSHARR